MNDSTASVANECDAGDLSDFVATMLAAETSYATEVQVQTGLNSSATSDNTITGGTGDDVLVLGTSAESNDTLVFSGTFGNDTVVNFVDDALANGGDILDFTAYLTTQVSASTSANSAVTLATVINDGDSTAAGTGAAQNTEDAVALSIDANSVSFETAVTQAQFDAFTNASILDDLNNEAGADTVLSAWTNVATAAYNSDTYKAILMIENAANLGEYKVVELTLDEDGAATKDFTQATIVGTVDFGDTLAGTFTEANLA